MIVLGIDPGTVKTGYGIVRLVGQNRQLLDYGDIAPPAKLALSERYHAIFEDVERLIARFAPDAIAVETQYVHKNVQSAIKLGMARGMVVLAAARQKVPLFEYSPTKAKKAVVGNGRASKQQVQAMIKLLLHLPQPPQSEDAADALALALCHLQAFQYQS